ncbi:hypothetical protein C472_12635 [Halorubrum tebenquichense DSM 14210]|uniref:Uncharacterized protein n=1 Tax=Halorubrum tebenquichense DSM 14210 TaxID=1227485 RepID=M0DKN6_9EURY|nr:hypothetical protein C472_12635 [Halorubrum tebenquichense DSM 14210]
MFGVLPVSGSTHVGIDGYYVAGSTRRNPALAEPRLDDPAASDVTEGVRFGLERAGSRKTHVVGVETSVSQPEPGHEFGNDTDAIVGLPAAARRVRLVDSTSEPTVRERPTPIATVEAEHGAIDLFDASSETVDDPVYLYDLEYDLQGDVDVGVWDTYGHDSILDADDVVSWARVFDTAHEFGEGELVIENGLLRLTIDEPTNADETAALKAETYDPSAAGGDGAWTTIALPEYDADLDTDWQPADVDLTHIGPAQVAAQVQFEAVAGVDEGEVYVVDIELERGGEVVEVWRTDVSDAIPVDLVSLLEPIASTSVADSGVEQGLVAREEVRE